jgi:hypothetical protein
MFREFKNDKKQNPPKIKPKIAGVQKPENGAKKWYQKPVFRGVPFLYVYRHILGQKKTLKSSKTAVFFEFISKPGLREAYFRVSRTLRFLALKKVKKPKSLMGVLGGF